MWKFIDRSQYPIPECKTDPRLAKAVLAALFGDTGEYGSAVRYMVRRHTAPIREIKDLYAHLAAEELDHAELVSELITALVGYATHTEFYRSGYARIFAENTAATPYADISSSAGQGDLLADISSDMAREMQARVIYDNLLRITDDRGVRDVLKFLRQREIVHYQRLGETKRELSSKSPNADSPHPRKQKQK